MKSNPVLTKIVAALVSTGVILPSCSGYFIDEELVENAELPDIGISAINLPFDEQEISYLLFLSKLGNDIIEYPQTAREFIANPQKYIEKYGFCEPINLDDSLLKLILALGDNDVNSAINAEDYSLAINLLKNKGLLTSVRSDFIDLSNGEITKLYNVIGIKAKSQEVDTGFIAPIPVIVFAIAALALAIAAGTIIYIRTSMDVTNEMSNVGSNSTLRILKLKSCSTKTYIAVNKFIDDEVDKIYKKIESLNYPMETEAKEQVKNFIKINIINRY
ncbi:hypothetical protein [Phocaeicola oris]|uniref:hypothetical protein n=1 Tax=Phocaeicola oris TaxID=2896850 RepID=UPI00234F477C|nr:hypothetical protein [Phocaeicola oris]MCE2615395.1 hypothetical protein [Phocaeicola oris]